MEIVAAYFEELVNSQSSTEEGPRKSTTRLFHVGLKQNIALSHELLPKYDDPLPTDALQTVVSRSAIRQPGSVADGPGVMSIVTIVYSTDGGTSWGGNNPGNPLFFSRSFASYDVEITIPYAFRNPVGYKYPTINGTTIVVDSYDRGEETHWETRKKYVRQVRLQNVTLSTCESIAARSNKLHKMGSLWYRFVVGEMQEISRNVWETTYSWEYDPGTPPIYPDWTDLIRFPRLEGTITGEYFPSTLYTTGNPAPLYTRPPFNSIYMLRGYDPGPPPVPHWPKFRVKLDYEVDANGWQGLPGMII